VVKYSRPRQYFDSELLLPLLQDHHDVEYLPPTYDAAINCLADPWSLHDGIGLMCSVEPIIAPNMLLLRPRYARDFIPPLLHLFLMMNFRVAPILQELRLSGD
jgi:hypothetical protein